MSNGDDLMINSNVKNYMQAFRFSTFKGYVFFAYDFNQSEL